MKTIEMFKHSYGVYRAWLNPISATYNAGKFTLRMKFNYRFH